MHLFSDYMRDLKKEFKDYNGKKVCLRLDGWSHGSSGSAAFGTGLWCQLGSHGEGTGNGYHRRRVDQSVLRGVFSEIRSHGSYGSNITYWSPSAGCRDLNWLFFCRDHFGNSWNFGAWENHLFYSFFGHHRVHIGDRHHYPLGTIG